MSLRNERQGRITYAISDPLLGLATSRNGGVRSRAPGGALEPIRYERALIEFDLGECNWISKAAVST